MIAGFYRLFRGAFLGLVLAFSFFAAPVRASEASPGAGVAVRIAVTFYTANDASASSLTTWGSFLPSTPTGIDGDVSTTATKDEGSYITSVLSYSSTQRYVKLEPWKSYTVYFNEPQNSSGAGTVRVAAPPGYRVILDGEERELVSIDTTGSVTFTLEHIGATHPDLAGMVSSVSSNGVELRISLGSLDHGGSAGDLAIAHPCLGANFEPIYRPLSLHYGRTDTVPVTYSGGLITKINAPAMTLKVVTLSLTAYELRCYPYGPATPSGLAPLTYRIEQGSTVTSVKFTREYRNVTTQNPNAPVFRSEWMTIERTGTWPAFTWKRTAWTPAGEQPVVETTVASGGTSQNRTESISVAPPGGTVALNVSRAYSVASTGEMLASELVGATNPATVGFEYYTDSSLPNAGRLKAATLPGGNWVSFEYYTDPQDVIDGANGWNPSARGGLVKYRFAPYGDSPASASYSPTTGKVTYYEYTGDFFNLLKAPSLIETKVNGVITQKTQFSYLLEEWNYFDVYRTTRKEYVSGTDYLEEIRHAYTPAVRPAYGPHFYAPLRSLPISVDRTDGTAERRAYHWGTLSFSTGVPVFTRGTGAFGTREYAYGVGTALRTTVIRGKRGSGLGAFQYDNQFLPGLLLADGSSTMDVTISWKGLVYRTEKHVRVNGAWVLASYVNYQFGIFGELTGQTASNGTTRSSTWAGDRVLTETDEAGVTITYSYDNAGRVYETLRAGTTNVSALKTRFTYDAAGNVTETKVGSDTAEPIITAKSYDTAGRLKDETLPGQGTITHAYEYFTPTVGGMAHTVTKPKPSASAPGLDGGTVVETNYRDGSLKSRSGTGIIPEAITYGVATDGRTWTKSDKGVSSGASSRWQRTTKDWAGREVKTEQPGFNGGTDIVTEHAYYNAAGQSSSSQRYRSTRPGPVAPSVLVSRMAYDSYGRPYRSGLDLGDDGLVPASSDRIEETAEGAEHIGSDWWQRVTSYRYPTGGSAVAMVAGEVKRRLTGFAAGQLEETRTTDADGNVVTVSKAVDATTHVVTVTTTHSGYSNAQVEKIENGLSVEITGFDGLKVTTVYDALHRPWKKVEQRNNNTTETTYVSGTKLVYQVKQKAQTSSPLTVSTSSYDVLGRKAWEENADGKRTYFTYNLRDQLIKQWGAATYPVAYAYNGFGEKVAMRTFRNPTQDFTTSTWPLSDDGTDANNPDASSWSTGDKTTWSYDAGTGLLASKTDAVGKATSYTYHPNRQLATREWARLVGFGANASDRVKTTYTYSSTTGEQTSISYNDGTPSLFYAYTRLGQLDTVQDATSTSATDLRDFSYDSTYPLRLVGETLNDFYGDRAISRLYDSSGVIGRPRGFKLGTMVGNNAELEQTYGYSSATGRFDTLNSSRNSNATTRTFHYGHETDSNLLKTLWTDDGFFVTRSFEANRDVLTSIDSKWGQNATNSISKYAYVTNNLGQRQSVEQSGDAFSSYYSTSTIHQTFTYNDRSELKTGPTKEGTVASPGTALSNRQHEFDYDLLGNRKYAGLTGNAVDRISYTTNELNQYSGPAHDEDGNITSDASWSYRWDAENRLVKMTSRLTSGTRLELTFKYDYLGRRVEKKVINLDGPSPNTTTRYLYDGWNVIAEYAYDAQLATLSLTRSYTWGLDIARTLADAGGVGALLQIVDQGSGVAYHPTYDGNGNIMTLVNASTGTIAAAYEYSPYGELIRSTGSYAANNPFRFSTKFTDDETGLVYYGRRYYSPSQGRFFGRDPKFEKGGLNLFGYVINNPINSWDYLGMVSIEWLVSELEELRSELARLEQDVVDYGHDRYTDSRIAQLQKAIGDLEAELGEAAQGADGNVPQTVNLISNSAASSNLIVFAQEPRARSSPITYRFLLEREESSALMDVTNTRTGETRQITVGDYVQRALNGFNARKVQGSSAAITLETFGSLTGLRDAAVGDGSDSVSWAVMHGVFDEGRTTVGSVQIGPNTRTRINPDNTVPLAALDDLRYNIPSNIRLIYRYCNEERVIDINRILEEIEERLVTEGVIRDRGN